MASGGVANIIEKMWSRALYNCSGFLLFCCDY